jgi:hypothetical protein
MKYKFNLLVFIITTYFVLPTNVLALSIDNQFKGFNGNYLQLGYSTSNYKHTDKITNISGSVDLDNNYSISGGYSYLTGDWNDPGEYETQTVKKISIGVGKYFPLNSTTDITSSLMYKDWDITGTSASTTTNYITNRKPFDLSLYNASIGIRTLTAADIELSLQNTWSRLKSSENFKLNYYTPSVGVRNISDSGLELGLKYTWFKGDIAINQIGFELLQHINESIAIGGRFLSQNGSNADLNERGIFVRRYF